MEVIVAGITRFSLANGKFSSNAVEIYDNIRDFPSHEFPILKKVAKRLWIILSQILTMIEPDNLREVGTSIKDVIDFEGSSLEARFIVKRGVDEEVTSSNCYI